MAKLEQTKVNKREKDIIDLYQSLIYEIRDFQLRKKNNKEIFSELEKKVHSLKKYFDDECDIIKENPKVLQAIFLSFERESLGNELKNIKKPGFWECLINLLKVSPSKLELKLEKQNNLAYSEQNKHIFKDAEKSDKVMAIQKELNAAYNQLIERGELFGLKTSITSSFLRDNQNKSSTKNNSTESLKIQNSLGSVPVKTPPPLPQRKEGRRSGLDVLRQQNQENPRLPSGKGVKR